MMSYVRLMSACTAHEGMYGSFALSDQRARDCCCGGGDSYFDIILFCGPILLGLVLSKGNQRRKAIIVT